MRYRTAIIGTGKIAGAFHAPACSKLGRISLEAACDINLKKLNKFCRAWGLKDRYSSVRQLLDKKKLDLVVLCTPNHTHFSLVRDILSHAHRPRILLVEKPLCLNKAELLRIDRILKNTNTKLLVNHKYRFHPGLKKAAALIKKSALGELLSIRCVYYGGLLNNGVHVVDTLRMLSGSELKVVSAKIGAGSGKGDPCIDARLSLVDYPRAEVSLESFPEKYYQLYETEIKFASGRIKIRDFGKEIIIEKTAINNLGERELKDNGKIFTPDHGSLAASLFKDIVNFLDGRTKVTLSGIGMGEVSKTMNSLWAIREKA